MYSVSKQNVQTLMIQQGSGLECVPYTPCLQQQATKYGGPSNETRKTEALRHSK